LEQLSFPELGFEVQELQPTKNCKIWVYVAGCYPWLACSFSFRHQEALGFVKKIIELLERKRERCFNPIL